MESSAVPLFICPRKCTVAGVLFAWVLDETVVDRVLYGMTYVEISIPLVAL